MLHPDTPPDPQPGDEVEDKVNGGVELPTNSHDDSSPGQAYDDILSTPPFAFEKTAVQLPSAFQEYIHNEPVDTNDIEATNDENAVQKHHIRFEQRLSRQPSYATSNASFSLSPHQQSHSPQPFLPLHHLPSQQSHLPHNIAAFEAFSDYTQHLDGHFTPNSTTS
ncbi:hypothetical protein BASA60_002697 [Batrachochytrium salamandrivorans]|nr:hypothetical protein BASA60_002697 [Batrachochytrium salamandrivorans]